MIRWSTSVMNKIPLVDSRTQFNFISSFFFLTHSICLQNIQDIFIFTPDYLIICNSFTRYPFASNQPDSVKVGQVEQSLIVQKSSIFVDDFSYRAIKDQIIDA